MCSSQEEENKKTTEELEKIEEKNKEIQKERLEELKKVSGLSEREAKEELLKILEKEKDMAIIVTKDRCLEQEVATQILNYIYDTKTEVLCVVLGDTEIEGINYLKLFSEI